MLLTFGNFASLPKRRLHYLWSTKRELLNGENSADTFKLNNSFKFCRMKNNAHLPAHRKTRISVNQRNKRVLHKQAKYCLTVKWIGKAIYHQGCLSSVLVSRNFLTNFYRDTIKRLNHNLHFVSLPNMYTNQSSGGGFGTYKTHSTLLWQCHKKSRLLKYQWECFVDTSERLHSKLSRN